MTGSLADPDNPLPTYLRRGERVLWEGKPNVTAFMLHGAWFVVPFSLVGLAAALFWEWSAISGRAPFFFRLCGLPFVLVGLYLFIGRFFVAARQATSSWYAVTDQRILIYAGIFRPGLTDLSLAALPVVQYRAEGGGRGTITFGSGEGGAWVPGVGWTARRDRTYEQVAVPAFRSIERAGEVYRIIDAARTAATPEPPGRG